MVKRALISVSDKTGVTCFAQCLLKAGYEILSTGGTAKALRDAGIDVTDVSEVTGFPEMMNGRVKTLHPRIHGALLGLRDNPDHVRQAKENNIEFIDIVAVNLYPFRETVAKPDVTIAEAVENIDIGGPSMLRSAAKNFRSVAVICDPADYEKVLSEIEASGSVSEPTRERLAVKAFRHTADYDAAIDTYLSRALLDEKVKRLSFVGGTKLRYGENWHQEATYYRAPETSGPAVSQSVQLHGKELSYNNYVDMDTAFFTVKSLEAVGDVPCAAIVKHNNPCGIATGKTLAQALSRAWSGDPVSAFGSIICVNRPMDIEAAKVLEGRFVEIIIAPSYDADALEYLKNKSANLRILELADFGRPLSSEPSYKYLDGGLLEQTRDIGVFEKWDLVTKEPFPDSKKNLAAFAMIACKCLKSNTITLGWEYEPGCYMMIGMGVGQPNRVDSIKKLGVTKTRENLQLLYEAEKPDVDFETYCRNVFSECVLASDAFFPFDDSVIAAHEADIKYVVSPGGSVRDNEVIATADRLGVSLIFTGMRHFLH
ncbi:bifunctional phosphoribosylaminoimidazolecarboxamide formyltransferase/IMP cyclohydrolase [Methanosarcinaceae archaeon]|nr:bifunctional phosphoribosylaminoimidazolecarboxamide formyltransferase/IMP cyclohydrolase [Methanosarcinaceae archaeon]